MGDGGPVVVGAGVFVPEGLCALLSEALRSRQEPSLRALRDSALQVAAARTGRQLAASAGGPRGPSALAPPGPPRVEWITTTEAARLLGVTGRQVRRLAWRETVTGRHDHRGIWSIDAASVRRLAHERTGKRAGSDPLDPSRRRPPDRR